MILMECQSTSAMQTLPVGSARLCFGRQLLRDHSCQFFLRHLSKRRQREVWQNFKALWKFIFCDFSCQQKSFQFIEAQFGSVAQQDAGAHALTKISVRNWDASNVLHRGMRQNKVLDLFGADLLSAPVDQVLLSTFDDVVAGGVLPHQISRPVEAISSENPGVVLGNSKVAAQRVWAATAEFAHFPHRHLIAVIVENAYLIVRRNWTSHGFQTYLF